MADPAHDVARAIAAWSDPARPFVTLTYAQTLDGSIAVRPDVGLAISSPETKRLTHRLRARHDGILVGVGTVLADDPKLTARRVGGPHPTPIILDSRLRTPPTARVFEHPKPPIILTSEDADDARESELILVGARVVRVPSTDEGLDLAAALARLRALGLKSVMVEGGAQVLTSFLREQQAQWAVITIAPYLLGGYNALTGLVTDREPPPLRLEAYPRIEPATWRGYGRDMVVWGPLQWA
ncbi:MAG: GTP cyclohydrolase [Chloroflexi bacterium]|nr:GTP cyclohydrolase [Chloroflexota bacterium]